MTEQEQAVTATALDIAIRKRAEQDVRTIITNFLDERRQARDRLWNAISGSSTGRNGYGIDWQAVGACSEAEKYAESMDLGQFADAEKVHKAIDIVAARRTKELLDQFGSLALLAQQHNYGAE